MRQTELIHRQVELVAVTLAARVRRIHDALTDLAFLTRQLLAAAVDPAEVDAWVEREGFAVQPSGFFERPSQIARAAAEGKFHDDFIYAWGGASRDRAETRRRMYLFRTLREHLAEVHARFKGVAYVYFQCADNPHAALVLPGFSPESVIPADFDWHTYHSFTVAAPAANPARTIRWTPPNIDYADQGLIACVSIPVWEGERLLGVWTMDVPLSVLHADLSLDALGAIASRQVNFLADRDGRLIAHPSLDPERQGEKGAVYNIHLSSLGGDYATLDVAALIAEGHGQRELRDAAGERVLLVHRAVPEIGWVAFASFPAADLVEATREAFQKAFASLGQGDLSVRLDAAGDESMRQLVASYNEMAATLEEAQRRRDHAEAEHRRLAIERERMGRELEIAATIQSSMLPRAPRHPGFEFAGRMEPADEVGGDFYDVLARPDGHLWITIGDVSSHGLGAGLVMMIAQSAWRAVFEAAPSLPVDEVIRHVNRLVHANASTKIGGGRYLTGQLLAWDGDGAFTCAGAHLWPLVVDPATGDVRQVESVGPWLGIVPELPSVPVSRLPLAPGEVLCLYSDGVIEARGAGGEMYDLARLCARLAEGLRGGGDLAACAEAVLADVRAFAPERDDDRTVLLARRLAR